jgi:hypothetical protein
LQYATTIPLLCKSTISKRSKIQKKFIPIRILDPGGKKALASGSGSTTLVWRYFLLDTVCPFKKLGAHNDDLTLSWGQ